MAGGKHILGKPKNHRTVLVLGSGESGLVLSKPEVLDRVARQILEDMGRNEEK